MKWWQVEILNEVAPRMDAAMTFIDNRLYIFGGRGHESYSIASFDNNVEKWTWVLRDESYPPYIPHFGFSCEVLPVYGRKQILLLPGCLDEELNPVSIPCTLVNCTVFTLLLPKIALLQLFCLSDRAL